MPNIKFGTSPEWMKRFHGNISLSGTLEGEGLKAVIYSPEAGKPSNDLSVRVGSRHLSSSFLKEIWSNSVAKRVPRAAILAKPVNGRYRSFILLPRSMMDEQISIIYDAAEKFPDVKMKLVAAREYDQDLWNWI